MLYLNTLNHFSYNDVVKFQRVIWWISFLASKLTSKSCSLLEVYTTFPTTVPLFIGADKLSFKTIFFLI